MRYKVANYEVKLFCEFHHQELNWVDGVYYDDDEDSPGPLDPLHWRCPALDKQIIELNFRQDDIDRKAMVPLGKDYPVGAKKRVPMTEWPQELIDAWARCEEAKDTAEEACRESWAIQIVPINQT